MIKVNNLSFAYDKKNILKDVNLTETEPVIIGLWGRNGSGKTTLMKILSGMEQPNDGTVEVDGIEPYNNSDAMNHVAFMQEDHPYSDMWDINDALRFGRDFNENWDQELADKLIDIFQLPRKKKIRTFSKGMKTMITIAIGLASKAPLTIFDEPSNGLDAHMRKQFYDVLLDSYDEHPRMILLSSHHIEEVEPLCEKIAIIDNNTLMHYEETDVLKNNGVHISGTAEAVRAVVGSKRVLEERKLGKQLNIMLDTPLTDDLKREAEQAGVMIEKAPFQDYLVNLTTKEAELNEHA
ncbi:ABC transporter ATP-binding protein [Jeotgalicoccus coquinae]|uniref:ABC transporter ATP-binding protein YtrB n=1 Tax=Jeotgalicoccus coquinae TaxID=709509 RepID=A0A6V7RQ36_9STAP|nr:ABC transporter ATP-binding protein [Jeotgalicoccus coquinae]MBB6422100.1 ABC-2 type transport system ATP-binding protein [Jeotgalicoccus coquinae]GGE18671.1 ABC transporter ATP-binding protein [Jeotgalicoccus coquinae]CAD2079753.1 ABC transporter ATP-binding protein YtrB [Jeotgalicoccus coquinae]